jgi:hypothetical protein
LVAFGCFLVVGRPDLAAPSAGLIGISGAVLFLGGGILKYVSRQTVTSK